MDRSAESANLIKLKEKNDSPPQEKTIHSRRRRSAGCIVLLPGSVGFIGSRKFIFFLQHFVMAVSCGPLAQAHSHNSIAYFTLFLLRMFLDIIKDGLIDIRLVGGRYLFIRFFDVFVLTRRKG